MDTAPNTTVARFVIEKNGVHGLQTEQTTHSKLNTVMSLKLYINCVSLTGQKVLWMRAGKYFFKYAHFSTIHRHGRRIGKFMPAHFAGLMIRVVTSSLKINGK
ncbi:hypothetical protein BaRGS_00028481 [Batillaria attramentaria]|uniref:Uncharacterized protein n=1 Tax=Batillaria attramentaria TaxID=370345 RepID=A0ABD0K0H8_9CAEN